MAVHDLPSRLPNPRPKVLSIGYACYDLTFAVEQHLGPDEKSNASNFTSCGGGLAANAAAAAGALGYHSILASYLGLDIFGEAHVRELVDLGVSVELLLRSEEPTGISGILVKPDGRRTLAAYRGVQPQYPQDSLDLDKIQPDAILVERAPTGSFQRRNSAGEKKKSSHRPGRRLGFSSQPRLSN